MPVSEEKKSTDSEGYNKKRRGVYLLPNLFTIGALFSGFFAIISAFKGQYQSAVYAIYISMIFDGLDGRVARLTGSQSEFGAQFDSLSDMVCFGVTPALVLYSWSLSGLGKAGWLAAFFYATCTALRLARFNSQHQQDDKRYFTGLSTPPAAALVASIIWVCHDNHISGGSISVVICLVAIVLGLLKVSSIKYRSFKDIDIRGRVPFFVILVGVLILVLVAFDPSDILLVMSAVYALSGPIGYLRHRFLA